MKREENNEINMIVNGEIDWINLIVIKRMFFIVEWYWKFFYILFLDVLIFNKGWVVDNLGFEYVYWLN